MERRVEGCLEAPGLVGGKRVVVLGGGHVHRRAQASGEQVRAATLWMNHVLPGGRDGDPEVAARVVAGPLFRGPQLEREDVS